MVLVLEKTALMLLTTQCHPIERTKPTLLGRLVSLYEFFATSEVLHTKLRVCCAAIVVFYN